MPSLEPPYVSSAFEQYKAKLGKLDSPVREFEIMQAFYAGAVAGLNIAGAIEKSSDRPALNLILKSEFAHFSESNKKLADQLGIQVTPL